MKAGNDGTSWLWMDSVEKLYHDSEKLWITVDREILTVKKFSTLRPVTKN